MLMVKGKQTVCWRIEDMKVAIVEWKGWLEKQTISVQIWQTNVMTFKANEFSKEA